MAGEWIQMGDGTHVHVKYSGRGRLPVKCQACFQRTGVRQCDYPTGPGRKTCDRFICRQCATAIDAKTDYCPEHLEYAPQANLFASEPTW